MAQPEPGPRPARVAVTGGIASGKSTVCALLEQCGFGRVDADAIGRELTGPGGEACDEIARRFGATALLPDGSLDRPAMRARVFSDPQARAALEDILHPRIRERSLALADAIAGTGRAVVFEIPLLAETPPHRRAGPFDRILVVDCPVALQVERAATRAGLGEQGARAAIAAQARREERIAIATDVIFNGGTPAGLQEAVHRLVALGFGSAM